MTPWRRSERAFAGLALVAPLALVFPWAAVPSNLGIGFGGAAFFFGWLTRYPNFGPVNLEVLLGIVCVIGASVFPAALGIYTLAGGRDVRAIAPRCGTLHAAPS